MELNYQILPTEIIDHIMLFLESNNATLLSCAKTCRKWRAITARYLYRNQYFDGERSVQRLTNILDSSPHIAAHVREVYIRGTLPEDENVTASPWIPSLFETLLGKLTNLRNLVFFSFCEDGSNLGSYFLASVDWPASITTIRFSFCEVSAAFFHDVVAENPQMHHLVMEQTVMFELPIPEIPELHLMTLDFERDAYVPESTEHCLGWVTSSQSITSLRRVKLSVYLDDEVYVANFLATLGATLEHLELHYRGKIDLRSIIGIHSTQIDLSRNTGLRTLLLNPSEGMSFCLAVLPSVKSKLLRKITITVPVLYPNEILYPYVHLAEKLDRPDLVGMKELCFRYYTGFASTSALKADVVTEILSEIFKEARRKWEFSVV